MRVPRGGGARDSAPDGFGGCLGLGQGLPPVVCFGLKGDFAALGLAAAQAGLTLRRSVAASLSCGAVDGLTPFWEVLDDLRDRPAGCHGMGTDRGLVFTVHQRIALDVAGEVDLSGNSPDRALRAGFTLLFGSLPADGASSAARRSPRPAAGAAVFDTAAGRAYHPAMASTFGMGVRP